MSIDPIVSKPLTFTQSSSAASSEAFQKTMKNFFAPVKEDE